MSDGSDYFWTGGGFSDWGGGSAGAFGGGSSGKGSGGSNGSGGRGGPGNPEDEFLRDEIRRAETLSAEKKHGLPKEALRLPFFLTRWGYVREGTWLLLAVALVAFAGLYYINFDDTPERWMAGVLYVLGAICVCFWSEESVVAFPALQDLSEGRMRRLLWLQEAVVGMALLFTLVVGMLPVLCMWDGAWFNSREWLHILRPLHDYGHKDYSMDYDKVLLWLSLGVLFFLLLMCLCHVLNFVRRWRRMSEWMTYVQYRQQESRKGSWDAYPRSSLIPIRICYFIALVMVVVMAVS